MSVQLYNTLAGRGPWDIRAVEPPRSGRMIDYRRGFCAEIIGRDENYRYARRFVERFLKDPDDVRDAVVWYGFRPRNEPYLLDIRHEQRGYYVLHGGIAGPELVQVAESLLAELLIARELDRGLDQVAFQTILLGANTTIELVRKLQDKGLKRSLLKTLDKATQIDDATREAAREFPERVSWALEKRAEPPAIVVVDRQRIRRVHFDS